MTPAYLEFELADPIRFARLAVVFGKLKEAKERDMWPEADIWLELFDDAARATFWWPKDDESDDQRLDSNDAPWHFESLIEAFRNGDYCLEECRRITDRVGRLEFEPRAWPYGGTGCMRGLIEAFGGRVLSEVDT